MKEYDVIIIGGGAAGLTSAIYTCRKQLKTAVITVDIGGQTNLTSHIENYPGAISTDGPTLMKSFKESADKFGTEFIYGKVNKIKKKTKQHFEIEMANNDKYKSRALVLAFGKVPRQLGVTGEERFMGRGVSTCVTCDAPLFKNKTVTVVGGGNSAVEGAEELSTIADKVYLIHRSEKFRADEITLNKVKKIPNIEILTNTVLTEIKGDKFISSIEIENKETKEKKELDIQGVFIEIGYKLDTGIVKNLVKLNEKGEVIINERGATSEPGIFAAGDITQIPFKQTVISAGDGAKAALELHKYLTNGKGTSIDW